MSGGKSGGNPTPSKRGAVKGWSAAAARRCQSWLQSVDPEGIAIKHFVGFALSLTVRECPQTAAEWVRARHAFLMRLSRLGAHSWHWLTEWQSRGVPHLHGMVFFAPHGDIPEAGDLVHSWLSVVREFGATERGQDVREIDAVGGWLEYLGKHGSRGVRHYQRASTAIPAAWRGGSVGRLWGYGGDWEVVEPRTETLPERDFARLGRMVRGYVVARAQGRIRAIEGRLRWLRADYSGKDKDARVARDEALLRGALRGVVYARRSRRSRSFKDSEGVRRQLRTLPLSAWVSTSVSSAMVSAVQARSSADDDAAERDWRDACQPFQSRLTPSPLALDAAAAARRAR